MKTRRKFVKLGLMAGATLALAIEAGAKEADWSGLRFQTKRSAKNI